MSYPRMHVSLYVQNIDNTVKFYEQFFEVKPNKVTSDYAKFILEEPSLIISFVENPERVRSNFGHLGFQVEKVEDVIQKLERLRSENIEVKEEIGVNCCYALQDKFWVSDPDGHQWEVYYFHNDTKFNDPQYNNKEQELKLEKKQLNLSELNNACTPGSGCC